MQSLAFSMIFCQQFEGYQSAGDTETQLSVDQVTSNKSPHLPDRRKIVLVRGLSKNRRDDGTTTGQDKASLLQLAAISC